MQEMGRQVQGGGQALRRRGRSGHMRRIAQDLADLLGQQPVALITPVLQHRQGHSALQHGLQRFFIPAQRQGHVAGVKTKLGLLSVELHPVFEEQRAGIGMG